MGTLSTKSICENVHTFRYHTYLIWLWVNVCVDLWPVLRDPQEVRSEGPQETHSSVFCAESSHPPQFVFIWKSARSFSPCDVYVHSGQDTAVVLTHRLAG